MIVEEVDRGWTYDVRVVSEEGEQRMFSWPKKPPDVEAAVVAKLAELAAIAASAPETIDLTVEGE